MTDKEKLKVQYNKSNTLFRFGDSSVQHATKSVKISAQINKNNIKINADVIDGEIPLLLSKGAMKKAGAVINLEKDEVIMFGKKIKLFQTKTGHYCVALNPKVEVGSYFL